VGKLRKSHLNRHSIYTGKCSLTARAFYPELVEVGKDVIEGEEHTVPQPATIEELGATAMMGSQLVHLFLGPHVEGANSIWYGRGQGLTAAAMFLNMSTLVAPAPRVLPSF
jgi:hypothetical protein